MNITWPICSVICKNKHEPAAPPGNGCRYPNIKVSSVFGLVSSGVVGVGVVGVGVVVVFAGKRMES